MLRSNKGIKYNSKEFAKFYKEKDVKREVTVGYAPEQNEVLKRKNRTVIEMVGSMLKEKDLPNKFWANAISTVVYILNRFPTKAMVDKINTS